MTDETDRSPSEATRLTPEQYRRLHQLIDEVLERPGVEREALVREALASEPGLLTHALALLQASDALQPDADDDVPPGAQIGAYRVVREIGRGGMGRVLLASRSDGAYDTEVAIKVVALGEAGAELVARFKRERRILALLEHPNIARLLDAGALPDGRPYFVMEYVRGRTITEHADFHQCSLRDRIELFLKACSAVEYAHQKRVVHRDIKPSNILVTNDGVPKLLDFGIATSLGREFGDLTKLTATGMAPGTPRYASPEQLAGTDVDIRTDVYALGVVLFELLTGWWPFVAGAGGETPARPSDAIQTHKSTGFRPNAPKTPAPSVVAAARGSTPRRLARQLRGDLDAIVSAALREDPTDRYDSVTELAADLRRHLSHQAVHARRLGVTYRSRRFVRRHWRIAAAAAVLAAVGASGAWVATNWNGVATPASAPLSAGVGPTPVPTTVHPTTPPSNPPPGPSTRASSPPAKLQKIRISGSYEFDVIGEDGKPLAQDTRFVQFDGPLPMRVTVRSAPHFLDDPLLITSVNHDDAKVPSTGELSFVTAPGRSCKVTYKGRPIGSVPLQLSAVAQGARAFGVECADNAHPMLEPAKIVVGAAPLRVTIK